LKLKSWLILFAATAFCGALLAQDYEGPTVLSRSGGGLRPYGERVGEDPKFRIYAGAEAIYDYGFLPVSTNSSGGLAQVGGQFGYQGNLGVYGTKRWRRTSLGLDYTGDYRGYTKNTYYNGSDNFLGLDFGDQLDRATLLSGSVTAGTANNSFGLANNLIGVPLGNVLPTNDIFDGQTYFINGGMGISRQINSRFGVEMRADGFVVERHSTALVSVRGYSPKISLSYRLNRRQTAGVIYNFVHYDYLRAFGEADVHTTMGFWSYEINRLWRFEAQGGTFVAATAATQTVAADPVVQALLGVSTITEAFSRVVALPSGQVRLSGKTKNSTFGISVYRGVGAGAGVTLTASETTGQLDYNYILSRSLSFGVQVLYTSATSLSATADRYSTDGGSVQFQYRPGAGSLVYTLRGQYRYTNTNAFYTLSRSAYQIGIGAGWDFRDIPFLH